MHECTRKSADSEGWQDIVRRVISDPDERYEKEEQIPVIMLLTNQFLRYNPKNDYLKIKVGFQYRENIFKWKPKI